MQQRSLAIRARLVGALVVLVVTTAGVRTSTTASAASGPRKPNVLFVLTDDLDASEMRYMPHTRALIAAHGTTFDRYFVSNSLCCPSRVTTLRGQYSHNTGVWSNSGTNGGFETAYANGIERDTVASRLHNAGYVTSLTGKYLNGYPDTAQPAYVPPGWTNWASSVFGDPYAEYNYVLNQNREFVAHQRRRRDYGTNVYVGLTDAFIRRAARAERPFFAYLSVYAPHQPATPAPQDRSEFPTEIAPRTPSFDQADVARSPKFVRDLPSFTPAETAAIDRLYRLRIRSLQAVDRGVARLVRTLEQTGQLDNTYVVFTSDNGFHLGQHRMPAGKQTAYETDIRVPLLVRGPGVKEGAHVRALAGNVDLAPTFSTMAGVHAPAFTDGRSLLPLLRGGHLRAWRTAYLIERRAETGVTPTPASNPAVNQTLEPEDPDQAKPQATPPPKPRRRHAPREIRDRPFLSRGTKIPDYDGLRTSKYLYVEYATGERELYDVRRDPDEIDNLAGRFPHLEDVLADRLHALRGCVAGGCRIVEARPVP